MQLSERLGNGEAEAGALMRLGDVALDLLGRPFEQVESHITRTHQGSGLGLAIAKSLTELHGGTMRIRSVPGRGTFVLLRMPIGKAEQNDINAAA